MSSSNRKNSVDIRGYEAHHPKSVGNRVSGTTMSALSATSLTLDSGVLVHNAAGQAILVTHTSTSGLADGDSQFTSNNFNKCFKLKDGEQVFMECDNLQDVLVGQTTVIGSGSISFEAH
tara:strand:+ start:201 stop:557 length:357 start_codon:yes stop_codon:yes gene_type:complete